MRIEDIDRRFGAAVRVMRVDGRLSQEDLAGRVTELGYEMSQATVGKIERGERKVTIGEAEAFAAALGTSTRTLVRGPETLTVDIVSERLGRLRAELKRAIEHFQIGQQVAASMIGALGTDLPDDSFLVDSILESPEDVLLEASRDNQAANARERHRESMETDSENELEADMEEELEAVTADAAASRYKPRLMETYSAKFGDTAPPALASSPATAAMLYGFAPASAPEEQADG